MSFDMHSHA